MVTLEDGPASLAGFDIGQTVCGGWADGLFRGRGVDW